MSGYAIFRTDEDEDGPTPQCMKQRTKTRICLRLGTRVRAGKKSTAGKKRTPISLVFEPMASM